jgi:hypothetical protein
MTFGCHRNQAASDKKGQNGIDRLPLFYFVLQATQSSFGRDLDQIPTLKRAYLTHRAR